MVLADGDAVWGRPMSDPLTEVAGEVVMGASSDLAITWDQLSGLTDLPRLNSESSPPVRLIDPGVPLWADLGWRQIAAVNLQVQGDAAALPLRASMQDRRTVRPLVFRDSLFAQDVDLMVAVVADRFEYERQAITHKLREYRPAVQWVGLDPTIYIAEQEIETWSTPATIKEFPIHNLGTDRMRCGRSLDFRMTAHSTVVSPFIRVDHADGTLELIRWQGLTLTSGQALTVKADRVARVGQRQVGGFIRSRNEDGSPSNAPRWPEWHPGTAEDDDQNMVTVGADSGTFTGFVKARGGF